MVVLKVPCDVDSTRKSNVLQLCTGMYKFKTIHTGYLIHANLHFAVVWELSILIVAVLQKESVFKDLPQMNRLMQTLMTSYCGGGCTKEETSNRCRIVGS